MALSQLCILNLAVRQLESDLEKAGEEIRELERAVAFYTEENSDFRNPDAVFHLESYSIPLAKELYDQTQNHLTDVKYQLELEIEKIYKIA